MRYVGILLMAGAAILAGFFAAACLQERLDVLLTFRQMVYHLKSQILYANATLQEALFEVGNRFSNGDASEAFLGPGDVFCHVAKRMETEGKTSFSVIWKEEIAGIPVDFPLANPDRQNLASLGENLGLADRDMQERTILFYLEQADDSIAHLKKEVEERTKLYRSLGMAAGVFLMIILA